MNKNPPNIYNKIDDYIELLITSKRHGVFRVKIDSEDFDEVSKIHWGVEFDGHNWYVRNRYKNIKLHRLVTKCPDKLIVDHINRDTLDNRKNNLRICTYSDNNRNRPLTIDYPHSTNEYGIGIWKCGYKDKVYSYFKVQIKGYKSKTFKTMKDAIKYRDICLEDKKRIK